MSEPPRVVIEHTIKLPTLAWVALAALSAVLIGWLITDANRPTVIPQSVSAPP